MDIGIKYCGGCNSKYDRVQAVKQLQTKFPQHHYAYVSGGVLTQDVWIVVCGCPAGCASTEGLVARKHLFLVTNAEDLQAVEVQLSMMD